MSEQLTEPGPGSYTESSGEPAPMLPGPVPVTWAQVPRVNLLPVEIVEARRFRRTQLLLAGVVGGAVLVAAAGVFWAQSGVSNANDGLISAQGEVTAAQLAQAQYATVPQVIARVDAATTARSTAMADDVLWYRDLTDLAGALPAGVVLTNISATLTTSAASQTAAAAATDPLTPAGIGTLTLAGQAGSFPLVADWIDDVNKINGLASAKLNSATKDTSSGTVTFSMTASVTSAALSGRYSTKAG